MFLYNIIRINSFRHRFFLTLEQLSWTSQKSSYFVHFQFLRSLQSYNRNTGQKSSYSYRLTYSYLFLLGRHVAPLKGLSFACTFLLTTASLDQLIKISYPPSFYFITFFQADIYFDLRLSGLLFDITCWFLALMSAHFGRYYRACFGVVSRISGNSTQHHLWRSGLI